MKKRSFGLRNSANPYLKCPAPVLLVAIYLACIALGTVLLLLPVSHYGDVGLLESVFTATSAVTVTGLSIVEAGSAFTPVGQLIIAILVQLGGLGLMTFAVLILSALGIAIGMPERLVLREDLNQTSLSNLTVLVKVVFVVAISCELIGAILLAIVFVPEFGISGVWHAIFHSISAFNNAGFSLHSDSLTVWVGNPIINTVIPALFILGGLGFIVVGDVYQVRNWRGLTLHSKLMLAGTVSLIAIGVIAYALLEWHNPDTLGPLTTGEKFWASWFQGVTPRTAGFNTVDTGGMQESTGMITMILMFVGAGSTSTAGGIKVTTLCVLILATIAFFKRRQTLNVFGRSLGVDEVMKVMALITLATMLVLLGIFIITISHNGEFFDLAFEVVSAFGTVGLSRGATDELDTVGLVVILFTMFIGRVGPLAVGFLLATSSTARVRYPAGQISLG